MIPSGEKTVYVVRDPDSPGAYLLVFKVVVPHPAMPGVTIGAREVIMPWRDARVRMSPESYANACRASFADWCQRNPSLVAQDEE